MPLDPGYKSRASACDGNAQGSVSATPAFVLEARNVDALQTQLRALGWISAARVVSAERIGNGNMNMTVPFRTDRSSFVLKQARPWVVKYPQIPAPLERAAMEARFYRIASEVPNLACRMPRLLGFDSDSSLLWLEDLGEGGDLTSAYQIGKMSKRICVDLTDFLDQLHDAAVPARAAPLLSNRAMRKLNHEHQYDLPLRPDSGMDLDKITPGLATLAKELKADKEFRGRIHELGQQYLAEGTALVHGDFFPGSWLATERGVAVIDPEFCHLGAREYDLGVFLAHLELIRARRLWDVVMERYSSPVDWALASRVAGAEIMRRLIGVAQLPICADLATKRAWLEVSRALVCEY